LLLFSTCIVAQEEIKIQDIRRTIKEKFFVSWEAIEVYSKSDITFKGNNYNFTLENAAAQDKPKGWHIDYINPARMTIPQTNLRIGIS
jgi:hypothetical protein